ncbi:MAG: hypothetical protein K0S38_963 [Candidatus Paceibacter sp.]|jgi:Na+-driven multidrug efflux pump|nr:hypothetical protein [Candidatus Paceibacter sp.]
MKSKRYWLRGSVILPVIICMIMVIFTLIPASLVSQCPKTGDVCDLTSLGFIVSIISSILLQGPLILVSTVLPNFYDFLYYRINPMVSTLVFYMCIGAILGFIYGKLKNKGKYNQ